MTTQEIIQVLKSKATEEKAKTSRSFFKCGKGEYAEGDQFIGVPVPLIREVAKRYQDAPLPVIKGLLDNPIHECRSCALFILVVQFRKAKKDPSKRKQILDFYLSHTSRVNNWDLVDASAPYIVGEYLKDKPRDLLYSLLEDPLLWNKRIAIVANWTLIRNKDFQEIFPLTEKLLAMEEKPHDLLQKACGWMLREVGKYGGMPLLRDFLESHAATMPRTMLRYALEKMSAEEKAHFMRMRPPASKSHGFKA